MLYIIKKINLPKNVISIIFEYLDNLYSIKNLHDIWFKRLISDDFYYYSRLYYISGKKHVSLVYTCLKEEETKLKILLDNNATEIIYNIHTHNLRIK